MQQGKARRAGCCYCCLEGLLDGHTTPTTQHTGCTGDSTPSKPTRQTPGSRRHKSMTIHPILVSVRVCSRIKPKAVEQSSTLLSFLFPTPESEVRKTRQRVEWPDLTHGIFPDRLTHSLLLHNYCKAHSSTGHMHASPILRHRTAHTYSRCLLLGGSSFPQAQPQAPMDCERACGVWVCFGRPASSPGARGEGPDTKIHPPHAQSAKPGKCPAAMTFFRWVPAVGAGCWA